MLDVEVAWARIAGWLTERAPLTATQLRGPAAPEEIASLQADLSGPLPDDLVRWWQAVDGCAPNAPYPLIPAIHVPLPVSEARQIRRRQLDLMVRTRGDIAMLGPAGEISHDFLERFVPIAEDGCGQFLYVDLRDGPWYGCVAEWDHQQGAIFPVIWDDVTSMLNDVADALVLGGATLGGYAERLRQGRYHADVQRHATVTADGALAWVIP
jgi:cell wall assembly regulator SMI1